MMILRFWSPLNGPLDSINQHTAPRLKGNDMRAILNRYIDNNLILNVSYFYHDEAKAFRREFIEPVLSPDGYPVAGKYSVKSKLLYGREVEYLVDVVPYSRRLDDEQPRIKWDGIKTTDAVYGRIINHMKYGY